MSFSSDDLETIRILLCQLGDAIREQIRRAQAGSQIASFSEVAGVTAADTIYQIDKLSEEAILSWFSDNWPEKWPVEVIMEGIEEGKPVVFPSSANLSDAVATCILDPIDGTRNLMHDKRSAWALAALAPRQEGRPRLSDLVVAAMTELPPTKQTLGDQISACKGGGPEGIVAERIDLVQKTRIPLRIAPSTSRTFHHGFATFCKFFPEGKSLTARIEEDLWAELYGLGNEASPMIFDDQYISTGGQLYELLVGHDRLVADIRPPVLAAAGFPASLVCHPYDICTALIFTEAGGILETPNGNPIDAPLDTISPITWIGYANSHLADQVRPILQRLLRKHTSGE